jgi:hydroxyethylthiazole kinase-like uncharacterized protein yjeF
MRGVHSVADVRAAEQAVADRLSEPVLMQRAAHGVAVHCADLLRRVVGGVYGSEVVVLVGPGNNGGDALFAGALLARRGARVTAHLLDPVRAHADGLIALDRAGGQAGEADSSRLAGADLVLDGLVGIGGRPGLHGAAANLAAACDPLRTVAVDIPSGVDAQTGAAGVDPGDAVRADVTVCLGALKPGVVVGRGAALAGEVRLVDIGISQALPSTDTHVLEEGDVRSVLPRPESSDDKYSRGVVGVLAGSPQYPGAGVLATGSARQGGAGMVRYLGLAPDEVRARYPEVVVQPDSRPHEVRVQAWVVGPGLGTDGPAASLVADVLGTDLPVVVDADAITLVARSPALVRRRRAPTVLTPHDREFARIAGEPGADRLSAARRAARDLGATVLLKGDATIVAAADGGVFVNPTGSPWLATAGSGDVLTGLIGSLLAAGLPAPLAAASAAYLHGVAGQRAAADGPPTAMDVLNALRPAIASLLAAGPV